MKIRRFAWLLTMTLAIVSCHHDHDHAAGGCTDHNHDVETEETHACDEIAFTKGQAAAAGLKLEVVKPAPFQSVLKTSGVLLASQGDEHTLVATASGVVSFAQPSISEGYALKHGEVVATVSARSLQEGDPVQAAKIAFEQAEKAYKRAEELVADKIISQRDFEQARMTYEQAKTAYNAQNQNRAGGAVAISSPIQGYVKSLLVSQGAYVNVGDPIAVVTQNRKLQLRAEVSERHYAQVKQVRSAHFKTAYSNEVYRLDSLNGRVLSYGRSGSESSYYIPITFEFDNVGDFLSNSYAEVYLLMAARANVISIPTTALTEEQGLYFVYLQVEPEAYKKQEVVLGQSDGLRTEILTGLSAGDKVVIRGAIQVKLAGASGEIPHGHEH